MAEWSGPRIAGAIAGGVALTAGTIWGFQKGIFLPCFLQTPSTPEESAQCDAERAASANARALSYGGAGILLASLFGPPVIEALATTKRRR